MVDLPNIKNYPKETKRIYLIICIFAAFLNKRLANKMKKGLFYAILASILWAIVNPFIKQGLSYDFTPMNFAGIRFTTVGIILFAYTWHKGMWRQIRQHSKLFLNLILINMFMGYTAFYFGVDFVSGAISSIIMGMTPLINVLLAHLLASNDRLNTHKIISLIVSLIGLFLIIGMGSNGAPLDWKGITGIVLLLLSIIFQGYSAISVSEDKGKVNPIFLNAVQMFFGGLLIYMVGLGTEGYHSFIGKPGGFYASLAILVFISVFAFSFWFIALQSKGAKVSDINMCRLINPILGAVLSWIMLAGEYPTFSTVAGMLIIVSSLIIYFKGADIVKHFTDKILEDIPDAEIIFWDERLSTVAADRYLLEADVSRAKRKKVIDKMAAVFILQGYLDSLK